MRALRQDGAAALAGEVEVAVIGEVDDSGRGGGGGILDADGVALGDEADVGGDFAGEALVPVGADEGELDSVGDDLRGPVAAVEAGAAVEGVAAIVERAYGRVLPSRTT